MKMSLYLSSFACALFTLACGTTHSQIATNTLTVEPNAVATLQALGNSGVTGSVQFFADKKGVRVVANIQHLAPNTTHGFHIHEIGDCSAADGSSAGGHFNPTGHAHSAPDNPASHLGDLGNVVSDKDGVATIEIFKNGATLDSAVSSFASRSVILHLFADDLTSQPAGAAGARIACGVIRTH